MKNFFRLHKNLIIELTLLISAAFSIFFCKINIYSLLFSVLIHELGHITAAIICGARADNFSIHGFGVEISFPGKTPAPTSLFFISSGGPLASLIVAFFARLFKNPLLFLVNISIALINLIPAYPLDGGNILSSIISNFLPRRKVRNFLKVTGRFFGIIMTFLGITVLIVSSYNISLLYMGLFIIFSSERDPNPVVEITSANHRNFEKSSIFIIDDTTTLLNAANNLPVNSIGAVKDKSGKILSFVTPLYLYELTAENPSNLELCKIKKDVH